MTERTGESYYEAQTETISHLLRAYDSINGDPDEAIDPDTFEDGEEPSEQQIAHDLLVNDGHAESGERIEGEDIREMIEDYALAIDVTKSYRVWLSFGGPNAGIDVHTRQGMIESMEYFFRWGGEEYDKRLSENSPLGRYAAEQVEFMMECEQ